LIVKRILLGIYAALCALSLFLIPVSVYGWFGAENDPIGAAYAIILAMPWSLFLGQLGANSGSVWLNVAVMACGMLLNVAIILILVGSFKRNRNDA
jgi:hypothetical protein